MVDLDWDAWRANYDQMTFADQQAFYERVAELYPHQESANVGVANEAFDLIPAERKTVLELGGWNGKLAGQMLARGDVRTWVNADLVEVPPATNHPGYAFHQLEDYLWNLPPTGADVFVACHTIEHLSGAHLQELFAWINRSEIPWVYLEAPLGDGAYDWQGYAGSHVLEHGWDWVDRAIGFHLYERAPLSTAAAGLWRRG